MRRASRLDQIYQFAAANIASKISETNSLSQPSHPSTDPERQGIAAPTKTICSQTFTGTETCEGAEGRSREAVLVFDMGIPRPAPPRAGGCSEPDGAAMSVLSGEAEEICSSGAFQLLDPKLTLSFSECPLCAISGRSFRDLLLECL
jgi:hypothetical protein